MTMQSSTVQDASDLPMRAITEGVALHDVSANDENDLMFLKGERVALIKRLSNNMCLGYCEGVYGRFHVSDVAFPDQSKGQGDLLAQHPDDKSRSVSALAERGQQQQMDDSAPSYGTPQLRVAAMQQQSQQQKQGLLEPAQAQAQAHVQTQGHMQHRRQPSLPRRMKSDENLGSKPEPPVSSRRKVLSSVPIHLPKCMATTAALTPPIIPPRSSSRISNGNTATALHSTSAPPSLSQSLLPLPPHPTATSRESGGFLPSQSVPCLSTPRPEKNPSRPTSKRSSTSDSGYQQCTNPNQSSISIADYASEGTDEDDDDEADEDELERLDAEHAGHDGKEPQQHQSEGQLQQQRSSRGSTSVVDQLRARTKNAFQRVGFSLAPNARLFSDPTGKDIDLKVTRISTYSTVSNGSTSSFPQQAAQPPTSTSPPAPATTNGPGSSNNGGGGRIRQKSHNPSEREQPSSKENNPPRLMQRIRSWSVSSNQRSRPFPRENDAPEVPALDPKHLSSTLPSSQPLDMPSTDDQNQQRQQAQPQQPEKHPRRDPSWLSPPTGTAKGKALAEGRPYSLGQGIAGGRDFSARSSYIDGSASTAAPSSTNSQDVHTSTDGDESKIPKDHEAEKSQEQSEPMVDDYGFIVDALDDHADSASGVAVSQDGSAPSIAGSNSGRQEEPSWFPTSMRQEKRDENRRAARIRTNESKWMQLMAYKHPSKAKKSTRCKKLVREGIPPSLRGRVWLYLANADKYRQPGLYDELIQRETIPIHEVIERDIHRCYPDHIHFRSGEGEGQRDLRNVLRAYAHYKPQVGYCQGMGRLVGMMLMQMLAEDAFWLLVATIEGYMQNYYTPNLLQLRIDAHVFDLLLKEHDPPLSEHLTKNDMIPVFYMTPWFLTLFTMSLPWASVLRVWDVFYFDGTRSLFRVGLGILHLSRDHLLNNCPTSSELLAYILHIPMELLSPKPLLDATFRSRLHQNTLDRLIIIASQAVKEEDAAKKRARE